MGEVGGGVGEVGGKGVGEGVGGRELILGKVSLTISGFKPNFRFKKTKKLKMTWQNINEVASFYWMNLTHVASLYGT